MPETTTRPSQDPRYSRLSDRNERRVRNTLDIYQLHLGDFERRDRR